MRVGSPGAYFSLVGRRDPFRGRRWIRWVEPLLGAGTSGLLAVRGTVLQSKVGGFGRFFTGTTLLAFQRRIGR